jgi:CheY-like chemotaxis protein
MEEAFRSSKVPILLHVVTDGLGALSYLRQKGAHSNARRPDLILLDLNMPGMSGLQVLAEVKGDAALKSIPVAVLTTSDAEADIAASYQLQVNCYLVKPSHPSEFDSLVTSINDFWMMKAQLPPQVRRGEPRASPAQS